MDQAIRSHRDNLLLYSSPFPSPAMGMGTLPCIDKGERGEADTLSLFYGPLRLAALQLVPRPGHQYSPSEVGPAVRADGVWSSITLMRSSLRFLLQPDH